MEILVGTAAVAISVLTVWFSIDVFAHAREAYSPLPLIIGLTYCLALGAYAAATIGARLLVPRWRVEGGRVIGAKGLVAFTIVYAGILLAGLASGD